MTASKTSATADPAAQVRDVLKTVTDALHTSTGQAVAGSRVVVEKVMQLSEDNAKQLFETLQQMAVSKSPVEIASLYSNFVQTSAQKQANQLIEVGQIMARMNSEAWSPITDALTTAAKQAKDKK